jgi:hypothetical protein
MWLTSGGYSRQWTQTQRAIRNIKQLIINSIEGSSARYVPEAVNDLYLQRRVFTKVTITHQAVG